MSSTPRASTSIIAAGISAILGGALGAFSSLASIILFSFSSRFAVSAPFAAYMRPVLITFWIFIGLCALFVGLVGIQVIRLRNWARISMLVIAGCLLFFGVMGIGVIFFTLFATAPPDPLVSKGLVALVLGVVYSVPIAVSLWWLILFTRPSVIAQFHASAALEPPRAPSTISVFNNPECPLPIRIVGWYLASFVLMLPLVPFFPASFRAPYFGHAFQGPGFLLIYSLNLAITFVPGFGLLALKRWSYPLTVIAQLFAIVTCLYMAFSPSYAQWFRATYERLSPSNVPYNIEHVLRITRYSLAFGVLIPIAVLITLWVARREFFQAAGRGSHLTRETPPASPL